MERIPNSRFQIPNYAYQHLGYPQVPVRAHASRVKSLVAAAIFGIGATSVAVPQPAAVSAIRTSRAARATYLARANIWRDPGTLSAAEVLEGSERGLPYTFEQAATDTGLGCTFTQPGKDIGGGSAKFLCRTADGRDLRVKYWDPESGRGNREVFATVAASRLMWALGFNAVPALPLNVRCDRCPENPHEGTGGVRTRRYVAMVQAPWPTPVILSGGDINQGWSWKDLDSAIESLPTGPERVRQRTHFDALTLLGVFVQHGDRKSGQQRLYCDSPADTAAGNATAARADATGLTLVERAAGSACATPAVAIVDVGATFGGAGRTSNDTTASMNLDEWRRKRVFADARGDECRGELTVSLKAGQDGEGDPRISEEGRSFLVEQLHRLTPDHVRAIFKAARVDELTSRSSHHSVEGAGGVDAWVAAFQDKVRQIESRRCSPAD